MLTVPFDIRGGACYTLTRLATPQKGGMAEWTMAVQSTALACQNLLLAAHQAGLGACWMCAPLFCPDVVRDALTLSEDWEPQGLITVGYPAQTRTSERAPNGLSQRPVERKGAGESSTDPAR